MSFTHNSYAFSAALFARLLQSSPPTIGALLMPLIACLNVGKLILSLAREVVLLLEQEGWDHEQAVHTLGALGVELRPDPHHGPSPG
jgi:hypothetical protein